MKTAMTMMTTKTSLLSRLATWTGTAGALLYTQAALAVNSLPGGPAVNQLDLHPPVTKIAAEHQWLHYFMLVICAVIFVGVFGVMFYSIVRHRKSKGAQGRELPREHGGRDHLDRRAVLHRDRHGIARDQGRRRDEGHDQRRPHDQGHRLSSGSGATTTCAAKAKASVSSRPSI